MKGVWNGFFALPAAALMASAALATPTPAPGGDSINVHGNAPAVCTLGGWVKDSGPGTVTGTGSHDVTNTYSNSDMVDASAMSILGPSQTVQVHAPLLCNTAITWTVYTDKGAFRNDSVPTFPSGFSNQWLYNLTAGPYSSGGGNVGFVPTLPSDGTPQPPETFSLTPGQSMQVASFKIIFAPVSQTARMVAGYYSEKVTLTVSPSL